MYQSAQVNGLQMWQRMLFASARGLHAEREYLLHRFLSITVVPLRWDSSVALIWLRVMVMFITERCITKNGKKQKARPKGVNLKVRWRAKVAMR